MTTFHLDRSAPAETTPAGALPRSGRLSWTRPVEWVREYCNGRQDVIADLAAVQDLTEDWHTACVGAGLDPVPAVVHIVLGPRGTGPEASPATVLMVRLHPGQLVLDVEALAARIAPFLGAVALRIEARGFEWARVELVLADPLSAVVPMYPVAGSFAGSLWGRLDDGRDLVEDWRRIGHVICQGVTRSGKSVWTYGALAQVAGLPWALVTGCDPTGLLFRAFAGTVHAPWQASGLADHAAHEDVLVRLVAEMDARIAELPMDRDTAEISASLPLLAVVLEEYPGLLRALDAEDKDRGKRVRSLVARLLCEGAKVGVRVIILAQRAEASVVGALERAQCSHRLSFRTDNRATAELLHPGVGAEIADAHTTCVPGVALLSSPGRPLSRLRAPLLGGDPDRVYPAYVAAVRAACGPS